MTTRSLSTLLSFALIILSGQARAGTVWPSTITSNVTFTKAGSPHTWSGSLQVQSAATVTVEPGAIVQWGPGQELAVNGRILALGDPADPIQFGGVSDAAQGSRLYLYSSQTSEFRHVNFAHFLYLELIASSPQGNHLIEHCTFRRMTQQAVYLNQSSGFGAAARIRHCIFEPTRGYFGIFHYIRNLTPDSTPLIEYNAFTRDGLYIQGDASSTYDAYGYSYFRHNKVGGGIGVQITPCLGGDCGGTLRNIVIEGNDLAACTSSVHVASSGGALLFLVVHSNDVSKLSYGYTVGINVSSLHNNYWGTTSTTAIHQLAFDGSFLTNDVVPFATNTWFNQADVDGSDADQATRIEDADLVKRSLLGETNLAPAQVARADVDRDGTVTLRDALLLESYVRGLVPKLPDP
jgi:hypothetical protein